MAFALHHPQRIGSIDNVLTANPRCIEAILQPIFRDTHYAGYEADEVPRYPLRPVDFRGGERLFIAYSRRTARPQASDQRYG